MTEWIGFITAIASALTVGLMTLLNNKVNRKDERSKENHNNIASMREQIEISAKQIESISESIQTITEDIHKLRIDSKVNREGIKDELRLMLQQSHAQYTIQGFVSSHQLTEFLESYKHYKDLGGNGTAENWKEDVCSLPLRDDLQVINPYVELFKEKARKEEDK